MIGTRYRAVVRTNHPTTETRDDVTERTRPADRIHRVPGRDGEELAFEGALVGFASSQRDDHTHRDAGYAAPGQRCSACRWFEVRIFAVSAELVPDPGDPEEFENDAEPRGRYLVLTYGRSEVPGETDKRRAVWTDSPFEVVEALTQRDRGAPFLPTASARALAQAAAYDADLQDAYVNRAVA